MLLSEFIIILKRNNSIWEKIKSRLYRTIREGFEHVNDHLQFLHEHLQLLNDKIDKQNEFNNRNNTEIKELYELVNRLQDDVKFLNNKNIHLQKKVDQATAFDYAGMSLEQHNVISEKKDHKVVQENVYIDETTNESKYGAIDYFDFENHFRGSIKSIKEKQSVYLKYFINCKNVLDIGCGRGEMLSLLTDNGIKCKGIDLYEEYAEFCCSEGLDVVSGDGIAYLEQSKEKFDAIFVGQVVEHISADDIVRLCNAAYEKLEDGGIIIMETPNPCCLAIYTNAFYMDPSHIKPVHPATLQYLAERAGFSKVEIVFTEVSKVPFKIPDLSTDLLGGSKDNIDAFNAAMHEVSHLLFGSQDYAIVATK